MTYRVRIIDTKTGEEREAVMKSDWDDNQRAWWQTGNYSCDCNRWLEFERALGGNPPVEAAEGMCNRNANRFRVPYATLQDGRVIEIDGLVN